MTTWDPDAYDRDFSFVSAYGADVLGWLDPQPGERVLDLGCGTGELAAVMVARGVRVVGLDSDERMVAAAREHVPAAEFIVGDGHDFTLDEPVDAVFSNAALHWMTSPAEVVGCVFDALVPGGRFVAEFGASGNVARVLSATRAGFAAAGQPEPAWPWYFPSPAEYAAMLEGSGFDVLTLAVLDRPTRLAKDGGLVEWLEMFASDLLPADPAVRADVLTRVEERGRPLLWRDGAWWADYRRLRVRAVRSTSAPAEPW